MTSKPEAPLSAAVADRFSKLVDDAFAAENSQDEIAKQKVLHQLEALAAYQPYVRLLRDKAAMLVRDMFAAGYPDTISKVRELRRVKAFKKAGAGKGKKTIDLTRDVSMMIAMSEPDGSLDEILKAQKEDLYYTGFATTRFMLKGPHLVSGLESLADIITESICRQELLEETLEKYGIHGDENNVARLLPMVAERLSRIPMKHPDGGQAVYQRVEPNDPRVVAMVNQTQFVAILKEDLESVRGIYVWVPLDVPLPQKATKGKGLSNVTQPIEDAVEKDLWVTQPIVALINKWRKLRASAGYGHKNERLHSAWIEARQKARELPKLIEQLYRHVFARSGPKPSDQDGKSHGSMEQAVPNDQDDESSESIGPGSGVGTLLLLDFLEDFKSRFAPLEWAPLEPRIRASIKAVCGSDK
jgi:hypothetical protein